MKKLEKDRLPAFLQQIGDKMPLFVPVQKEEGAVFTRWNPDVEPQLGAVRTVRSPKDLFFPQCEALYTLKTEQGKLQIAPQKRAEEPFAVFGMRGCDARALQVLDQVFLTEPVDTFYKARRENGVLLTLACRRPDTACFCTVFQNDPADPLGDVCLVEGDTCFFLMAKTEKGQDFLDRFASLLTPCEEPDETACRKEQENIRAIAARLPLRDLSLEGWGPGQTDARFSDPRWDALSKNCLGCGTCTFVCPVCQCYDLHDYDTGHGVIHYRCWDSCMYEDFTRMSAGNNRPTRMQRYRQRFMHKLVYGPENNNGMYGCVGCGRCVVKCPSSLHIVQVLRKMRKEEEHAKL